MIFIVEEMYICILKNRQHLHLLSNLLFFVHRQLVSLTCFQRLNLQWLLFRRLNQQHKYEAVVLSYFRQSADLKLVQIVQCLDISYHQMPTLMYFPFFLPPFLIISLFLQHHQFLHIDTILTSTSLQSQLHLQNIQISQQLKFKLQLDSRLTQQIILQDHLLLQRPKIFHILESFQFRQHIINSVIAFQFIFIDYCCLSDALFWKKLFIIFDGSIFSVVFGFFLHTTGLTLLWSAFIIIFSAYFSHIIINSDKKSMDHPKNRTHHYNLFQFEEKLTNKFACNISRFYPDDYMKNNKQNYFLNIIEANDSGYPLTLIQGQIRMIIYDEGFGNYPMPGSYVQYRKKMYYEGDNKQLEKEVISCSYGKKENKQPIQLILSISKFRFKAKVFFGPKMSIQMHKTPPNKILVMEIQVISISDFPLEDNFLQLEKFHAQIIRHAIDGDQGFKNRNLEKSLWHYQNAIQKIFSEYYRNALTLHKKSIDKQQKHQLKKLTNQSQRKFRQNTQQFETLIKNRHNIELIQEYSQKIAMKAIEVAFLAKEFLKCIKWAQIILMNPKYEKNLRVFFIKSRAFVEMDEYDKALTDLKLALLIYPDDEMVQKQIKLVEQRKKEFEKQEKI